MTRGVLIFAHNSKDVDYAMLSIIAGGLAKKHLCVPVSVVTDKFTIRWMKESNIYNIALKVFDQIIEVEKPITNNSRLLRDGNKGKDVAFINSNRATVWEMSPYESTLLIDSDFLIFSDRLNAYWNYEADVMMGHEMSDIRGDRVGALDKHISETGVHMYWATTVMFKKNSQSKLFFDLVNHIKSNYKFYADIFQFPPTQFRNDIAFSVAFHMLNGYQSTLEISLPSILTVLDADLLHCISKRGELILLLNSMKEDNKFFLTSISDTDIHIMNKQSIIRNSTHLLELI